MNKEEILKKVRQAEEKDSFVKRCIRQNICPACGEGFFPSDEGHPFLTQYSCDSCGNKMISND